MAASIPEKWVPLDFDQARVDPGPTPGSYVLTVIGNKPSDSEEGCPVKLMPATYIVQPEYWQVALVWDPTNAIFQSLSPFKVSMPLDSIPGKKGVELIGGKRSERISVGGI